MGGGSGIPPLFPLLSERSGTARENRACREGDFSSCRRDDRGRPWRDRSTPRAGTLCAALAVWPIGLPVITQGSIITHYYPLSPISISPTCRWAARGAGHVRASAVWRIWPAGMAAKAQGGAARPTRIRHDLLAPPLAHHRAVAARATGEAMSRRDGRCDMSTLRQ